MDKLDMQTPNFTDENIEKLATLFPNCVTETHDAKGKLKKAIDFDLLKQELSDNIVDGPRERYQINWPGKKEALVSASTPINKTLRPCREESVDFDITENLYIEGDNLEALKLLQESYLGKIKMIYIDPPYNTGKDFVYNDNFTADKNEYDQNSGQKDATGNKLLSSEQYKENLESNGRYHSDWLSMMYPRLKLARNLLKNEGVIFISIDEVEAANLRKMCDEIFGEDNFVSNIIWQSRTSISNDQEVSLNHNHTLIYSKNHELLTFKGFKLDSKDYSNPDNDERGPWKLVPIDANKVGGDTVYPITNPNTGKDYYPPNGRIWAINRASYQKLYDDNRIVFGLTGDSSPKKKLFIKERELKGDSKTPSSILTTCGTTKNGTNEIMDLFNNKKVFSYPKPTTFIKQLVYFGSNSGDIILDFFSGSATMAHSVMQLNIEENENRKYICIQIPEETDEKSEAYKAGYKTIPEIGKERIRRAGKKIKEENVDKDGIDDLDIGFRVLKIDSSNMKDVYYTPDQMSQSLLSEQEENIKKDRTVEDLLFQVLLDWGVDLTLPITRGEINGKTVYFVDDDTLVACFDDNLDAEFAKEIAKRKPLRAVFKESGYKEDEDKINIDQVILQFSPDTEVRAI